MRSPAILVGAAVLALGCTADKKDPLYYHKKRPVNVSGMAPPRPPSSAPAPPTDAPPPSVPEPPPPSRAQALSVDRMVVDGWGLSIDVPADARAVQADEERQLFALDAYEIELNRKAPADLQSVVRLATKAGTTSLVSQTIRPDGSIQVVKAPEVPEGVSTTPHVQTVWVVKGGISARCQGPADDLARTLALCDSLSLK